MIMLAKSFIRRSSNQWKKLIFVAYKKRAQEDLISHKHFFVYVAQLNGTFTLTKTTNRKIVVEKSFELISPPFE